MQDLRMEVFLYENEDPRYNSDADILAQFLNSLREKYPQMIIEVYEGNKMDQLSQHMDIDYQNLKNYPLFILNGHIVSVEGKATIEDIENYIEEVL
ncbi:MAG: hypothetical protein VR72_18360 [Clostridiaceae bacterium BRH_c20a]|nr:MAG: hypothetical protein VR72_18360 [Clostridiaceae bacterium BRH_c20a]